MAPGARRSARVMAAPCKCPVLAVFGIRAAELPPSRAQRAVRAIWAKLGACRCAFAERRSTSAPDAPQPHAGDAHEADVPGIRPRGLRPQRARARTRSR